jgi:signal transduction histidine kinase/ActR/RegA family two-component response regulator
MSTSEQAKFQPEQQHDTTSSEEADELQTLFATSSQVVRQRDLKTALVEVLNGLHKLVPYDSGTVHYHRWDGEWLEPVLARGYYKESFDKARFPYTKSVLGRALTNHHFIKIDNILDEIDAYFPPNTQPPEPSALMVAPLRAEEQGESWVLAIRRVGKTFSEHDFKLFQVFASYAEIAIENVRLYEIALRETEALHRVNVIMSSVSILDSSNEIYRRVAEEVRLVLDYDRFLVAEVDPDQKIFKIVFDSVSGPAQVTDSEYALKGSATEQAVKTGHYFLQNDVAAASGAGFSYDKFLLGTGVRSYAIFPLRHQERVNRVILLASGEANVFDVAKLSFLEILAGQLAVAAENVHLFERLRLTRRQWQITLDAIPDAVLLLNAIDLTILQVNQTAATLAGSRPDELVGQSYRDIFYGVDPCLCYFPLDQLQNPGDEFSEEANGTFSGRIYQRSIYPIFDSTGRLSELVTHIREVTKTKMMEQQLAQTVRLKAVGEMAAGIAHDFNNSLAGILGNVELMLLEATDSHQRNQLLQLKQAALDGADTVRRIQSFGRKDGRKAYRKFELNTVVREVIELTRPRWQNQAQQQGVYIGMVLRLSDQLTVFGNPAEIKEAITNLIFNALDAMPEGGTLTLSSQKEKNGDSASAVLQITDTGSGIPENYRSKIFDPFFTTKGSKGTGLGLSMVRQIMAEHEGEIGFESEPGQGTTFFLRLPLVQPDRTKKLKPLEQLPPKPDGPLAGKQSRILVVDDDRTLCSVLKRILERYGHKVEVAGGGKEGLEIFRTGLGDFDIIFTDLSMPEMSGYELARVVKSLDPQVVVVLMTGWGADLNSETLASRGINLHIAKPYRINEVEALLEKAYELRRQGQVAELASYPELG